MFQSALEAGAARMGLTLDAAVLTKLAAFHERLIEANRTMNLTRVPDDPAESVDRNYLDSLSPLTVPGLFDGARTLIDIGSGAGFPGLVLAIACPQVRVTLLDSLKKRVAFLQSVIDALGLNAVAIQARSEDAAREPKLRDRFDLATARAVADLPVLLELSLPFVRARGRLIAFKGPALDEELPRAAYALRALHGAVQAVHPVAFPGRDWDHRLLVIQKTAPTPKAYPRKAGEPGRKPLDQPILSPVTASGIRRPPRSPAR